MPALRIFRQPPAYLRMSLVVHTDFFQHILAIDQMLGIAINATVTLPLMVIIGFFKSLPCLATKSSNADDIIIHQRNN